MGRWVRWTGCGIVMAAALVGAGCGRTSQEVVLQAWRPPMKWAPNSQVVEDNQAKSRKLLVSPPGQDGIVLYGPYVALNRGIYEATYRLKLMAGAGRADQIGFVDVYATAPDGTGRLRASRTFTGSQGSGDGFMDLTLRFETDGQEKLEFRVGVRPGATVAADEIRVGPPPQGRR